MRHVAVFGVLLSGLLILAGCRAQQLTCEQDKFRNTVLELHTNQIMDNLIRVRQGLPIIQMEYTHMMGTITQRGAAGLGGEQSVARDAATSITNAFRWSADASQENQLTITAEPVTSPDVYNAYLDFLTDPNRLIETSEPPPAGCSLLVRCRETPGCGPWWCRHRSVKVYYFVPSVYREEFFKLCLYTVAMRGEAASASTEFSVTIRGMYGVESDNGDRCELGVELDKDIPNDEGWMTAVIGGRLYKAADKKIQVFHNREVDLAQGQGKSISKSQNFVIQFSRKDLNLGEVPLESIKSDLCNQKVDIRLDRFVPTGSRTENLLESIRWQLESIRLEEARR